jgi:hypothetical protein
MTVAKASLVTLTASVEEDWESDSERKQASMEPFNLLAFS